MFKQSPHKTRSPEEESKELFRAAKEGDLAAVRIHLLTTECPVDARNYLHDTPLHIAATNGHSEVCIFLFDQLVAKVREETRHAPQTMANTLVNKLMDGKNKNPLQLAEEKGHVKVVACLINDFILQGLSFLVNLDESGKIAKNEILLTELAKLNVLHSAAIDGNLSVIHQLVKLKFSAAKRGLKGCLPVHVAAEHEHIEACIFLLTQLLENPEHLRLNPTSTKGLLSDDEGLSPLHYAAEQGNIELVREITRVFNAKGLNFLLNHQDHNGATALHWALENEFIKDDETRLKILDILIKAGASPNLREHLSNGKLGRTPLEVAMEHSDHAAIDFLLEHATHSPSRAKTSQTDTGFLAKSLAKGFKSLSVPPPLNTDPFSRTTDEEVDLVFGDAEDETKHQSVVVPLNVNGITPL